VNTLTALDITRPRMAREIGDYAALVTLARDASDMASAGLNATRW
jgi:hypothetical protein